MTAMIGGTRALLVAALGVTAYAMVPGHDAATGSPAADPGAPRWWKGNTHTHTLWSDGDAAPEAVARWYREHGYHFLVLSDHNVLSVGERWFPVEEKGRLTPERLDSLRVQFGADWVEVREQEGRREMRLKTLPELRDHFEEPGGFRFLQGEEITDSFEGKPVHVNGVNLREKIPPQGGASIPDTMQRNIVAVQQQAREQGQPMLAHVNHPNFGWAITPEELADVPAERFFEVYNGHPSVHNDGDATRPGCEAMWDLANTRRLSRGQGLLYGLATDDAHHYHDRAPNLANSGRGWVMVRASSLEPDAIVEALMAGDFYASSGVTLDDVQFDGEELTVRIAAEAGVEYRTTFLGTREADGAAPGVVFAETTDNPARYRLRGDERFVRARVDSSLPHAYAAKEGEFERAWTQPVLPRR